MTNEELTKLFYKYNIVELSLLSIILSYIKSYEIKDVELSLQEVFNKKLIMGDCYLERQENLFYNVVAIVIPHIPLRIKMDRI